MGEMAGNSDVFELISGEVECSQIAESLCVNCKENGVTRLLLTKIPYYKKIILISFECRHCGYRNNEIQSGEPVQRFGTKYTVTVKTESDLNRQVIKSEFAEVKIPELELEVPHASQPGEITTIEGILRRVKTNLERDQERRRQCDFENASKIDCFVARLDQFLKLENTFTIIIDDPSGNSFVENPDPLHVDCRCIASQYRRTLSQNKLLALMPDDIERDSSPDSRPLDEICSFVVDCPNCGQSAQMRSKNTDIPYFQMVTIMATTCDHCGYRDNEVKSGGPINEKGCKITVRIEKAEDLNRDVLKSDTCRIAIPELDMHVGCYALSGRFSTVEGILDTTKETLEKQIGLWGDSAIESNREKISVVLSQIEKIKKCQLPATLILDDPAGNSYVQSLTAPVDDDRLLREVYKRSFAENEDLGLNQMKVENWEQ